MHPNNTYLTFEHDMDMVGLDDKPSSYSEISLDTFFSLKPEPGKKTITLELTEEQEASVRAVLGEQFMNKVLRQKTLKLPAFSRVI